MPSTVEYQAQTSYTPDTTSADLHCSGGAVARTSAMRCKNRSFIPGNIHCTVIVSCSVFLGSFFMFIFFRRWTRTRLPSHVQDLQNAPALVVSQSIFSIYFVLRFAILYFYIPHGVLNEILSTISYFVDSVFAKASIDCETW